MELKWNEIMSGIYILTNKETGRVYIGQSSNLYYRIHKHFSELKRGTHICKEMQNDYNNGNVFCYEIIECDEEYLDAYERLYIKAFKDNTYCKDTGGLGCGTGLAEINRMLNTGRHASEETRNKMSEKRRGRKMSSETLEKRSKTRKEKKQSKYSEDQILVVKRMLKEGRMHKVISELTGIPKATISAINLNKVGWWINLDEDNPVAATETSARTTNKEQL